VEVKSIPIDVRTQFFKPDRTNAKLSVRVRVDAHAIDFHEEQGRKVDELKVVTVLFDDSGQFVAGKLKTVGLRLRGSTLAEMMRAPLGLQTSVAFDVKPGSYWVREVVLDGNSGKMAALNQAIEIPF